MSAPTLKICPKESCGLKKWGRGAVVKKIGAGAGLIFKGSGFYITDYRSEGYKTAAKKESGESKSGETKSGESKSGESKAAAKTEAKAESKAETKSATAPVKKAEKK